MKDTPPGPAQSTGEPETQPTASILDAVEDVFEAPAPRTPAAGRTTPAPGGRPKPLNPVSGRPDPSFPPGLSSPDPAQRRTALAHLLASPGGDGTRGPVLARLLAIDPDPEIRSLAAEGLGRIGGGSPAAALERGLRDPDDGVRAACVRAAAIRAPEAVRRIARLIGERRWPAAQRAALTVLPQMVEQRLEEADLHDLLAVVARMDPPPQGAERPSLEAVAAAIGRGRLIRELEGPDTTRLGAARLLGILGDPVSLEALAALSSDPAEEIRLLAGAAASNLAEPEAEAGVHPEAAGPGEEALAEGFGLDDEVMAALAGALLDPEEPIRTEARTALGNLPGDVLAEWVVRALDEGPPQLAVRAAAAAEAFALREAAPGLLERAGVTPSDRRAPYLTSLASLRLSPADLVALVHDVDPIHRQEAVRIAWQLGGRAVVTMLSSLLQDSAGPVRMAVLELLAESGDPSTASIAQRMLAEDSSAAVRATAVHSLAWAGAPLRQAALAQALRDPDPDVRATAVEVLPQGISGQMTDLLIAAFRDEDDRVWRAALRHLAGLPPRDQAALWSAIRTSPPGRRDELVGAIERVVPERLAAIALREARATDPGDRAGAVELAARAGTAEATAFVVSALQDPHPSVRRSAAAAMRVLRTPLAVSALSRVMSDPHAEVRIEATRALGMIDDDSVPDTLIAALRDPEIRVREMASEALVRWQSPAVARRLASALASAELRESVASVLRRMDHAAVEPLVEAIMGKEPDVAGAAALVLARITGPEVFVERLSSTDPETRRRAVEVLGAMGGPPAADGLLSVLTDPDIAVRARAVTLLGGLGDARAIRPLRRVLLSDPVPEVASAAEAALARLGDLLAEAEGEDRTDPESEGPGQGADGA